MVQSKHFCLSEPLIFLQFLLKLLQFKMSRKSLNLHIFSVKRRVLIKYMRLESAVLEQKIFPLTSLMSDPLLFLFQFLFELPWILFRSRTIRHGVVRSDVVILSVFGCLRAECALTEFLSHQFLLYLLLLLTTFRVVGQFLDGCPASCYCSRNLIDLRLKSVLSINFPLDDLPHHLLLLLVLSIESHDPILGVLAPSGWVTLNNNLRSGIDLWFERVALFISPLSSSFLSILKLSLHVILLAVIKVFVVPWEQIIWGWHVGRAFRYLRMERVLFVHIFIHRHVMTHLFFDSIISISI